MAAARAWKDNSVLFYGYSVPNGSQTNLGLRRDTQHRQFKAAFGLGLEKSADIRRLVYRVG